MSDMRRQLRELANSSPVMSKKDYARRCVERWSRTPLLKGLENRPSLREQMAMILENQLRHTLNESNTISTGGNSRVDSGNVQGYTAIAFPMVRKIFGEIIANNIASIQTMNAPTGLIFYVDFVYSGNVGGDTDANGASPAADYPVATYPKGNSLYGQPVGAEVRTGATRVGGQFDLSGSGYSRWHEPATIQNGDIVFAGAYDATGAFVEGAAATTDGKNAQLLQYDPQVLQLIEDDGTPFFFLIVKNTSNLFSRFDLENARDIALFYTVDGGTGQRHAEGALTIPESTGLQASKGLVNVRRLNVVGEVVTSGGAVTGFKRNPFISPDSADAAVLFVVHGTADDGAGGVVGADAFKTDPYAPTDAAKLGLSAILRSNFRSQAFASGATNLVPVGESDLNVDPRPLISEISLKLGTEPVTVEKRAYRIKWTDDLATDVKAQLAIDVGEVLVNTMSDAIQIDIDRELLQIMVDQASAARFYWSKQVGKFIDYRTGRARTYDFTDDSAIPAVATAVTTRDDWYSGLTEVVIHAANEIHTRTLRGQANFAVASADVASILEVSRKFVPTFTMDRGQVDFGSYQLGSQEVGLIEGRLRVYRCVDFPRNLVLVGYKGEAEYEAGFVYCPYVPIVMTPRLANTEDFQNRQAVFTRYAKKMVRADYFAVVTVLDQYQV